MVQTDFYLSMKYKVRTLAKFCNFIEKIFFFQNVINFREQNCIDDITIDLILKTSVIKKKIFHPKIFVKYIIFIIFVTKTAVRKIFLLRSTLS